MGPSSHQHCWGRNCLTKGAIEFVIDLSVKSCCFTILPLAPQAVVKAIRDRDCKAAWGSLRTPTFCLENTVSNFCSGDSGGPITLLVTRDGTTRHEVYGAISYNGCDTCNCNIPDVVAKISGTSKGEIVCFSIIVTHCSRRGPRLDFGYKRQFQRQMNCQEVGFQKM